MPLDIIRLAAFVVWPANHFDMDSATPTVRPSFRFTWTQLPTARKSTLSLISAAPTDRQRERDIQTERQMDSRILDSGWMHWRTVQIMHIASACLNHSEHTQSQTHVKFVIL